MAHRRRSQRAAARGPPASPPEPARTDIESSQRSLSSSASSSLPPSSFSSPLPPRARPNSTEVCGFVLWIASYLLLLLYLLWAWLPSSVLHSLSITYYPSKYWALAIPAYLCTLPLFVIAVYASVNLHSTHDVDSIATMEDAWTRYAESEAQARVLPAAVTPRFSIPDVYDMRLETVSAYLHGRKARRQ